jgi:hypothetical protein
MTTPTSGRSPRQRLWKTPSPDLDVSPTLFSVVAALTVAIRENPWLAGSNRVENDPDWREILIPDGHGIPEYRINRASHEVILTRIVLF